MEEGEVWYTLGQLLALGLSSTTTYAQHMCNCLHMYTMAIGAGPRRALDQKEEWYNLLSFTLLFP